MKSKSLAILLTLFISQSWAFAGDKAMKCETGPLAKTYGKTSWVVYSCLDNRTVVIHSASGNPAMPFYFMFFPDKDKGGYRLYGEGTGKKDTTAAAYEELKSLSEQEITALIAETKSVGRAPQQVDPGDAPKAARP